MGEPALKQETFSYDEYREMEDLSPERHIFWDGQIYAMSGASDDHNTIESNAHLVLGIALRGRPCRASTGNRRLRALHSEKAVYADAVVICGKSIQHPDDKNASTNPVVIVEVLSPDSTEGFDRGDKFAYYRTFPSVKVVVFVVQKEIAVERHVRGPGGAWTMHAFGVGETMSLDEIGVSVHVDELYEGTPLEVAPAS